MILAVIRNKTGLTNIKSDSVLTEEEKYFIQSYNHILAYGYEYTLLDFINKVLDNYKGEKLNSLIYSALVDSGYGSEKEYKKLIERV